jgi:hypothetical protein
LRRISVLLALIATLAGCADGGVTPVREAANDGEPPGDIARVVCEDDSIRVDTDVVRAHGDGVLFVFENPGGVWGFALHHATWDRGTAEGGRLSTEPMEYTSAIAPGQVTVACLRTRVASYSDDDAATATISVVDPDGLYVPFDLACGWGVQSRIRIDAPKHEDPDQVFRRIPGIRELDVFKEPNYPGSPQYGPTAIVFRDGVAVGRIMNFGDEWEFLVNACVGSGIAGT